MFTRRRFLAVLIPGLAVVSGGVAFAGYRTGGCPLSSAGYCVGPCTAFRDGNGDLICDRLDAADSVAAGVQSVQHHDDHLCEAADCSECATESESCGGTDPVDVLGYAPCDREVAILKAEQPLATPTTVATPAATAMPIAAATPTTEPTHAVEQETTARRAVGHCPFSLTNDPYPGRCRRYIDLDENGICDYSEPPLDSAP